MAKNTPASNPTVKLILTIVITLIIGLTGGLLVNKYFNILDRNSQPQAQTNSENKYAAFLSEVKTVISDNYWQQMPEEQLVELFVLATEKTTGQQLGANIDTFAAYEQELTAIIDQIDSAEKKEEAAAQIADMALANLQPPARSRLYSKQKKQELADRVTNKETEQDHYQALEVEETAEQQEIDQAYQQKKQNLEQQDTPEAKQELQQVEKAYQTLKDEDNRERYNEQGVNPTMNWELVTPEIFHLQIKKFSPTTVQELAEVTSKVDQGSQLDTLILDLRDNVGGAIDGLPYFLGPFIGNNQYAYQFIQQGKTKDFKTKTGWLPSMKRYKKIVILINENTQSSGEVMASVLKKYNVGPLVGTTTRGWGTIERVYPLENQLSDNQEYSVFLVHHLTLRADGTPIQSNGVEPTISVESTGWEQDLQRYFDNPVLVEEVKKLFSS